MIVTVNSNSIKGVTCTNHEHKKNTYFSYKYLYDTFISLGNPKEHLHQF